MRDDLKAIENETAVQLLLNIKNQNSLELRLKQCVQGKQSVAKHRGKRSH